MSEQLYDFHILPRFKQNVALQWDISSCGRFLRVITRNKGDIVDRKQFNFRNCWRNHRMVHALRQLSLILWIRWSIMTFTLILAVRLNIKSILSTRCVDAGCTMILVGNRYYFCVVLPFKKWSSFVHVQLCLLRLLICRWQGSLSNKKRSQMCKWSKRYVYGAITIIMLSYLDIKSNETHIYLSNEALYTWYQITKYFQVLCTGIIVPFCKDCLKPQKSVVD